MWSHISAWPFSFGRPGSRKGVVMPTYSFKKTNGKIVDEFMTVAQYERRFGGIGGRGKLSDGTKAVAVLTSPPKAFGGGKNVASRYPYRSWSMGCNRSQRKEMSDYLASQGCPTEIAPDGDLWIRSQGHQRKVHKALDLHDTNGTF